MTAMLSFLSKFLVCGANEWGLLPIVFRSYFFQLAIFCCCLRVFEDSPLKEVLFFDENKDDVVGGDRLIVKI